DYVDRYLYAHAHVLVLSSLPIIKYVIP
mgnify:CR=1